ncbi:MAG TPA: AarF/UbiB family protein [Usitatibacter sp.]|nr:AarF/UbiB family protein [Usitatibacter sp.]
MLITSIERIRALPRLAEITRVLVQHGVQDLVHSVGLHRLFDETGALLGWQPEPQLAGLPIEERVRLALESLGPAFVKLGQVLASRVDLLDPAWIAALDKLHDQATPVPYEAIEAQLVADLGGPVASRFRTLELEPNAAGSIAQVHRGTLPEGTAVAVKIRRPGVEGVIAADVLLLETLAAWWEEEDPASRRYQPVELVRQLRKSLAREVDFASEARAQERFAANFDGDPDFLVPRVHGEFTRASLLVMDWVDGVRATDLAAVDAAGLDREALAARGADAFLKMVLVDGLFHADPHPGNMFFLPGNRVVLIDFGMVGWLSGKRRDELVDLLAAVAARDPEAMRDVLVTWTDGHRVAPERLAEDLGRLLHIYERAALREIRLGTLISEVSAIVREQGLMLPADLALLFKALITLEGLGTRLVPRFRLIEHVTPFVRRLMAERWGPKRARARLKATRAELGRALRAAPRLIEALSRHFADDGVAIRLEMREVDNFSRHLEGSVNRLTIGMVTAALIVGSSILFSVSSEKASFTGWFLGAVGVAISLVNTVWLILAIRRSRRS